MEPLHADLRRQHLLRIVGSRKRLRLHNRAEENRHGQHYRRKRSTHDVVLQLTFFAGGSFHELSMIEGRLLAGLAAFAAPPPERHFAAASGG
jgi:hypothetical protein